MLSNQKSGIAFRAEGTVWLGDTAHNHMALAPLPNICQYILKREISEIIQNQRAPYILPLLGGSCHLDLLNVEIGVEYRMISVLLIFNCSCEIHFGAPSLQKLNSDSSYFDTNAENKKANKYSKLMSNSTSDDLSKLHDSHTQSFSILKIKFA